LSPADRSPTRLTIEAAGRDRKGRGLNAGPTKCPDAGHQQIRLASAAVEQGEDDRAEELANLALEAARELGLPRE
jgi:hypothetical protein